MASSNLFEHIGKLTALALGYYLTGSLGVLLAIPPGYATAVWPASGIALAGILLWGYRFWPGILIGSFSINLFLAPDITGSSIALALVIASGAAMQAVISAWMIGRFVTIPNAFVKGRDISLLLILGGPVGCIVNATIGPLALVAFGITAPQNFAENWATWWVGDTIGVTVFTPVLLLLFTSSDLVRAGRKMIISFAMLAVFLIAVTLFSVSKFEEREVRQIQFAQTVSSIKAEFIRNLEVYLNILIAAERHINASDQPSYRNFEIFTEKFLASYPGIYGLSWNAKVTHPQRKAFEARVRAEGFDDFIIKNRFSSGRLDPAPDRPFYFPVTYTVPYDRNKLAHGFDTYGTDAVSGAARVRALDQARDTGRPVATGRISIVQAEGNYGLLIYHPVYETDMPDNSVKSRRKHLMGYTVGVFQIPQLMTTISATATKRDMHVVLRDISEPSDPVLLFDSRTPDFREPTVPITPHPEARQWAAPIAMAGSNWELTFIEADRSVLSQKSWSLWMVLIGGLLFTGLMGTFLLVLTGWAEKQIGLLDSLGQANQDLERFANIAAHDLREPLRRIEAMCGFLGENIEANQDPEDIELVNKMRFAVTQMRGLVDDFHDLSMLSAPELSSRENVGLQALVEKLIEDFEPQLAEKDMTAEVRNLPRRNVHAGLIKQLFTNLINNALKYSKGQNLNLDICYNSRTSIFSVSNTGSFINEKHLQHIFDPFMRGHQETPGSGLGLYICRRVVESHEGKIWAESEPNRITVKFTLSGQGNHG